MIFPVLNWWYLPFLGHFFTRFRYCTVVQTAFTPPRRFHPGCTGCGPRFARCGPRCSAVFGKHHGNPKSWSKSLGQQMGQQRGYPNILFDLSVSIIKLSFSKCHKMDIGTTSPPKILLQASNLIPASGMHESVMLLIQKRSPLSSDASLGRKGDQIWSPVNSVNLLSTTWRFPKMLVPPKSSILIGFSMK